MVKWLCMFIVALLPLIMSCQPDTPFNFYKENLFRGKESLRRGEFAKARDYFVKASEIQQLPESQVYAAIASYKINDMKWAEYFIREADKHHHKGLHELRIDGYKALIFLMGDNKAEGFLALEEYVAFYSNLKPLTSIWEVESMVKKRRVDIPRLEVLIDEQVEKYEDEVEQFQKTRTGFLGGG